jgi:hypothetical protein
MNHCVVKFTNVSEVHIASIIRTKYTDDGGSTHIWNVVKPPDYATQHPRRLSPIFLSFSESFYESVSACVSNALPSTADKLLNR